MKRSRMKRKAAVPKNHKDADSLSRFHEAYPDDELECLLSGAMWERHCETWHIPLWNELHHVFHAGKKADVWWNYVMGTNRAHRYAHRDPVGSTIASLYAILRRSTIEQRPEIRESWRELFGRDVVDCYVQCRRDNGTIPEWAMETAEAILEMFSVRTDS
jgi:hypothetical protein